MDWDNKIAARDPYDRFRFGIPPAQGKADFAFIQHMFSSLNRKGRAAIISSQGILFRRGEEEDIRTHHLSITIHYKPYPLPSISGSEGNARKVLFGCDNIL